MFTFVPARDFNAKKLCWRGKQCQVLKQALIGDGLARGLREAAKALDKRLVFVFDRNINNVNILVFSSGRPCSAYWPITVTSPCTRSLSPLSVRWIRINWMDLDGWVNGRVTSPRNGSMGSVQVGKAVFVKENYTTLGIEPRTLLLSGEIRQPL